MSNSFVTLWTVTHLSMGFPRQEYCSGVAISFCRWSSWLRDRTHVSCIVGRFFTTEPPGKTIHTHTPGPGANPLQILRGHCTPRGGGGKSWIFLASCLELVFSLIILWVHVMWPVPSVALASLWSERSLVRRAHYVPCPSDPTSQPRGRARNSPRCCRLWDCVTFLEVLFFSFCFRSPLRWSISSCLWSRTVASQPLESILGEVLTGHFAEAPSGQENLPHFISS